MFEIDDFWSESFTRGGRRILVRFAGGLDWKAENFTEQEKQRTLDGVMSVVMKRVMNGRGYEYGNELDDVYRLNEPSLVETRFSLGIALDRYRDDAPENN